jgi:tetratricopeptide (TPR) repeat protein
MASTARLDELKKKFDENPRRYFAPLANEHRKSGDLDQAIALCRTHLPQQPAHISGHIVLAQALYEAGSLDESRDIFHTALGLDPENLIALRYLGDIARDSSDLDTARSWYARVLEVDPRNDEIVQLVRELDVPPAPIVAAEPEAPAVVAQVTAPPAEVAPEPEKAPAEDRFAPLSLEELDIDAAAPSAEAVPELHVEEPMLGTPGVDPFDMPAGASAESLFDMSTEEPSKDYFLEAFADTSDTSDVASDAELLDADWTPAPEAEVAAPESATPAPVAELDVADFEAGEFYVEPPPPLAVPANEAVEQIESSTNWSLASETPDAPRPVLEGIKPQPETEVVSEVVAEAPTAPEPEPQLAPTAEIEDIAALSDIPEISDIEMMAGAPTAEWNAAETQAVERPVVETPVETSMSAPSMELGLESMEFVPPTNDTPASADSISTPNAEISGTPTVVAEQGTTPAAFVTETMAELYLQQGFRNEALAVYRELLARNPGDASLRERIEKIESGSMSSIGMAMVSENVVESAIRRQSAKPTKSVRSFFAALASRRAPAAREVSVADLAPEPLAEEQYAGPEPVAEQVETPDSSSINAMMSAAETLASYDPFAEEPVAETDIDIPAPELLPNESHAVAEMSDAPPHTPLEQLFPDTPVAPRSEAAANTLATAFGRPEPQGRPTRAASSELSLDKVFRGSSEGTPPADGGFSFDQFFSDSRSGGDVAAAPTVSPPDSGRSGGGAGDAHDIEQFTAWLEGLKKK